MFTSLSLENFKSWRSIQQMRLAPITGLFGANSSGKSSILQFLLMLKQTVDATDRATVLEFGNDKNTPVNLGSYKEVIYARANNVLSFALEGTSRKLSQFILETFRNSTTGNLGFSCEISEIADKLSVDRFSYALDTNRFVMKRDGSAYHLQCDAEVLSEKIASEELHPLPRPTKFYGFPHDVHAFYKSPGILPYLQLELENLFEGIHYLGPLRDYPQRQYQWRGSPPSNVGYRGELAVQAIIASKHKKNDSFENKESELEYHIAHWLHEWELIHSFSVEPLKKTGGIYEVRVKKTTDSTPVLLTDVGFGVSQVLPVLTLCYYVPEGSTLILEQPEIHLHPSVQSGLADLFIEVAYKKNLQIIFESHSEHLLRRLQRRIAEERFKSVFNLQKNSAIYFCEFQGEQSHLSELQINPLGDITNWPEDFFGDEIGEMNAMLQAAMKQEKA
jgi:predicted ATPase